MLTWLYYRLLSTLPDGYLNEASKNTSVDPSYQAHMIIVLGSGGHTAEMISILRGINPRRYFNRTYVASSGDSFARQKAWELERYIQHKAIVSSKAIRNVDKLPNESSMTNLLREQDGTLLRSEVDTPNPTPVDTTHYLTGSWHFHTVPRARKIHQSLYTTPFTSLWSFFACLRTLQKVSQCTDSSRRYPDVIISNGPATAVMVVYAALCLRFLYLAPADSMKIIYVESWARVASLSLSGEILLRTGVCNRFVVQWDNLRKLLMKRGYRVENAGYLVE